MMLHRATPAELQQRLDAERRGTPFLPLRDADGAQRIVDLAAVPERLTIGRDPASGLALDWDGEVSRVHAALERVGNEWTLVDDGSSRNGTYLEGERLHGRARIRDGDAFRIGRTTIVFCSASREDSVHTLTAQVELPPVVTEAQRRVLV